MTVLRTGGADIGVLCASVGQGSDGKAKAIARVTRCGRESIVESSLTASIVWGRSWLCLIGLVAAQVGYCTARSQDDVRVLGPHGGARDQEIRIVAAWKAFWN